MNSGILTYNFSNFQVICRYTVNTRTINLPFLSYFEIYIFIASSEAINFNRRRLVIFSVKLPAILPTHFSLIITI